MSSKSKITFVLIISLFLFCTSSIFGEQTDILDSYINLALESNITLKQKQYSYAKSLEALKEAKRKYFPVVSLEATYTKAEGGRTITLPFGDMLNPAYENLNLINNTLEENDPTYPEVPTYPGIDNFTMNFVRETEQETKLQASMPVFNTDVIYNHKVKKGLAEVEEINIEIYKRELVKEVKTAYVNYLQALEAYDLYKNTLAVVNESLRNRESLYKHDKITIDEVYAARAKVKEIEKDLAEAEKDKKLAQAYFNFLLNREFETPIDTHKRFETESLSYQLDTLKNQSIRNREEIVQLDKYLEINSNQINLENGDYLPQVSLWASYGYQGEEYNFDGDHDLGMVGLKLSWNIFLSGQRQARIQQAKIEQKITSEKKKEAEKQIQLNVIDGYYSLVTATKGIELAEEESKNYIKTFNLVSKKYDLGMANHLEYTQALNDKLNAQNKLIVARYEYEVQKINLERLTSSYELKTNINTNEKNN